MFFSKSKKINFSPEDAWRVAYAKAWAKPYSPEEF